MGYSTTYSLLDKNKNIKHHFKGVLCFSDIVLTKSKFIDVQYLEYDFSNHSKLLSTTDMYKYFLFIKNIEEFAPFMPYDVLEMAQELKVTFDITKVNGLILFALLTVIRVVVENPEIVQAVLAFDGSKEYSWTKLGILKACGAVHYTNMGHWLTGKITLQHVNNTPAARAAWRDTTPTKETGLCRGLNDIFQWEGDGYGCRTPVTEEHIKAVLKETQPKKAVKKEKMKKVEEDHLQVDF